MRNNPLNINFMGLNQFVWWFGVVTSSQDPEEQGRIQVRIHGFHDPKDSPDSPDDMLPWAIQMMPTSSPSTQEKGISPTGITKGSTVFGFFLDGEDGQFPFVLGTYAGTSDTNVLATGTQKLDKTPTEGIEPASPYGAKYPNNRVFESASGHVIEIDDTKGAERIHVWHKSGSYLEIGPDGSMVRKTVASNYDITVADNTIYVGGDVNVVVLGNANIDTLNDAIINVSGSARMSVKEDIRMRSGGSIYIESAEAINMKAVDGINIESGSTLNLKGIAVKASPTITLGATGATASGLSDPQARDTTVNVPSIADAAAYDNDDAGDGSNLDALIASGIVSASEVSSLPSLANTNITTKVPAQTTVCGITLTGNEDVNKIVLSPKFTVGKLSRYALVSHDPVAGQTVKESISSSKMVTLSAGDIVCALKLLAVNTLEPLVAHFPTAQITSGFRRTSGSSQHGKGQAADIQYSDLQGLPLSEQRKVYYDRAVWIINNVPFDQFLLEYKTYGTGKPWHHITFAPNLRHSVKTFLNDKTHSQGLSWLK